MEESVRAAGYVVVPWDGPAAVRVFNSCTVTAKSDRECRHEVRRAKRRDPGCLMVLTGCFAHVAPERAAAVEGVDLVLGNADKARLVEHLECLTSSGTARLGARVIVSSYPEPRRFPVSLIHRFSHYTRAFLEVQTGCEGRCAYCVIPQARGRSCSMPLHSVVEQVEVLGREGFREVVLTGIDLGKWGLDTGEGDLARLVEVLAGLADGPRLRLSSIEPMGITGRLIDVIRETPNRVAHHFHVPLQSGCSGVLERMNRPYTGEEYLERVGMLREAFPDAALGADVIAGFPGETAEEFAETVGLIEASPLTYLHVFPYSDRPGTPASALRPKVTPEILAARSRELRELGARRRQEFLAGFLGREVEALVLRRRTPQGLLEALTGNYMRVCLAGPDRLMNTYVQVRVDQLAADDVLVGSIVDGGRGE